MSDIIEPRVLKGFRDFLPEAELERRDLVTRLESVFRRSGYVPIDTPVLEYAEILLGKAGGETEKQVYRFTDQGGRDVAMRFDLTVPFARFMAEHSSELYLPFKRYHMAKVWRGENTQRGRYREFMQCDFDIVGTDSASADFETVMVIHDSMLALGVKDFSIHLNHRGIFNRFLERSGILDRSVEILRAVDKLGKLGEAGTKDLLAGMSDEKTAGEILDFIRPGVDFDETLARVTSLAGGGNPDSDRVREIHACAVACGITDKVILAPNITRGLDYYTGIVFETFIDSLPGIGSVCSGGRYNDLASLYTKTRLPGVGASVGMDRLLAALETLGRSKPAKCDTRILVICMDDSMLPEYWTIARELRAAGIASEVYPEKKKLAQQYAYAERKGIPFALARGPDEKARGVWTLKNMANRESLDLPDAKSVIGKLGPGKA